MTTPSNPLSLLFNNSGQATFNNTVTVTSIAISNSTNTGALIVNGGVGVNGTVWTNNLQSNGYVYANGVNYPGFLLNSNSPYYGQIGNTGTTGTWALGFGVSSSAWGTLVLTWNTSSIVSILGTATSVSTSTGALNVKGGIGVGDSVYVGNRVGFVSTVTNASAVYQIYNSITNSLDTVFG